MSAGPHIHTVTEMRNDHASPPSADEPQGTDDLPAGPGSPARRALAVDGIDAGGES